MLEFVEQETASYDFDLMSGINCYRLYQHVSYQLRHKRGTYTYLT